MGESSPSLLSSMWFLLALPALVAGQCQVNLDKVNGKYPPLLLQNSQFIFPTEKVGEERVLNFEEADSLDLFCHGGSDEKQARIFVRRSDKSKKGSKVSLTCKSGEFFVSGSEEKIAVEKATCNQKQEPRLDRKQEQCAPVGDDGRTDKLESLQRVSIGWQVEGTFIEQIGICIDESNFGTIWTNHTVRGASIALRDIDPKRPSFRADTGAYTRKNQRFFKWSTCTKRLPRNQQLQLFLEESPQLKMRLSSKQAQAERTISPRAISHQMLRLSTMCFRTPPTTSSMLLLSSNHSTMATGRLWRWLFVTSELSLAVTWS